MCKLLQGDFKAERKTTITCKNVALQMMRGGGEGGGAGGLGNKKYREVKKFRKY